MTEEMPQGKETVSDDEIIEAIASHEDPIVSASEIADIFDHSRQWAHYRLQELYEDNEIHKKDSGGRSVVWWISD